MSMYTYDEKTIENDTRELLRELRMLDSREISDGANRAMTMSISSEKEIIYKDRLFLAKRRGDPIMLRIIADANCAYCRRLINLSWTCCPYCSNGKISADEVTPSPTR